MQSVELAGTLVSAKLWSILPQTYWQIGELTTAMSESFLETSLQKSIWGYNLARNVKLLA